MLNLFYVFLGGAIGSVLRYEISKIFLTFFIGTLIVNVIGSFLLGYFCKRKKSTFLISGFCGGLTTFSTFSYELVYYLENKMYILFSAYIFTSVIAGLLGAYFGEKLGEVR